MNEQNQHPHQSPTDHIQLPKRDRAKTVWIVVAVIAIAALIGLAVFGYVKVKNLNKQISDQQAQITELNNKKKTLEDAASAAASAAAKSAVNTAINAVTSSTSDQDKIKLAISDYCAAQSKTVIVRTGAMINFSSDKKAATVSKVVCNSGDEGAFTLKKGNNDWIVLQFGQSQPDTLTSQFGLPNTYPNSINY